MDQFSRLLALFSTRNLVSTKALILMFCLFYWESMAQTGQNCNQAITLSCGYSLSGTTVGGVNDYNISKYSCHSSPNQFTGEDRIYKLNIHQDDWYIIELTNLSVDLDIFLTADICNNSNQSICMAKSTGGNNSSEKIGPIYLRTNDDYYLIVDGYASNIRGNYVISFRCLNRTSPSACQTSASVAPLNFHDNFEVYNTGPLDLSQSRIWQRWDQTRDFGTITAERANTGSKSLKLSSSTGQSNILLPLGNIKSGRYRLSWKLFVPNNRGAVYNLQHNSSGNHWAYTVQFATNKSGFVEGENKKLFDFTYAQDEWISVTQIIDIDEDRVELFINGKYINSWQFSLGNIQNKVSKSKTLGAVNIYTNSNNTYYIDDICFYRTGCYDCIVNPSDPTVCIYPGKTFSSPCIASCNGYSEEEWNAGNCGCNCPSDYEPVCVNGKTYTNACLARCDGHSNWTEGSCSGGNCIECFNCFTWKPRNANEVLFDHDYCTSSGGEVLNISEEVQYSWQIPAEAGVTFLDGTNASSSKPICRFPRSGHYKVCFIVYSKGVKVYECCKTVIIGTCIKPPIAFANYSYNSSTQEFVFDGSPSTDGEIFEWDFGGGTKTGGTEKSPRCKFNPGKCYTVCLTVSNPCGSSKICFTVCPGNACSNGQLPPSNKLPVMTLSGDALEISNLISGDEYTWKLDNSDIEFQSGSSPSSSSLRCRFKRTGYHHICLIIRKGCHLICYCWTFYYPGCCNNPVKYDKVTFELGEQICGNSGQIVKVPVKVYNFTSIQGFSFSIKRSNPSICQFVSLRDYSLSGFSNSNSIIGDDIQVTWYNPDGLTVADGTTIFNIEVMLIGPSGQGAMIYIDHTPQPVIVYKNNLSVPYFLRQGSICIGNTKLVIQGNILSPNKNPINNTTVFINRGNGQSMTTDIGGYYGFAGLSFNSNNVITCEKLNHVSNGLTIGDLIKLQNHINGRVNFTKPEEYIAADIDKSRSINSTDVSLLRNVVFGTSTDFGLYPSWTFIPSTESLTIEKARNHNYSTSINYNPLDGNKNAQNFVGIKAGDVNFDADYEKFDEQRLESRNNHFIIRGEDITVFQGEVFSMPLSFENESDIQGLELKLVFKPEELRFIKYTNHIPGLKYGVDYYIDDSRLGEGTLKIFTINKFASLEIEHALGEISFMAIREGNTIIKYDNINIFGLDGERIAVKLDENRVLIKENSSLIHLTPNPAEDYILVTSKEGNIELAELINVLGQRTVLNLTGQNSYTINIGNLSQGVYYLKGKYNNRAFIKPIVVK